MELHPLEVKLLDCDFWAKPKCKQTSLRMPLELFQIGMPTPFQVFIFVCSTCSPPSLLLPPLHFFGGRFFGGLESDSNVRSLKTGAEPSQPRQKSWRAQAMEALGWRRWPGPFDWVFSSPEMVAHCLAEDGRGFRWVVLNTHLVFGFGGGVQLSTKWNGALQFVFGFASPPLGQKKGGESQFLLDSWGAALWVKSHRVCCFGPGLRELFGAQALLGHGLQEGARGGLMFRSPPHPPPPPVVGLSPQQVSRLYIIEVVG